MIDLELMWQELSRITKPNAAILIFGCEPFSSYLRLSNIKNFKYDWIWEKSKATNFLNAKKQPLRCHEIISVFYKKQPTYNPQMVKATPYDKGVRKPQINDDVYGKYNQHHTINNGERYPRSVQYYRTAESEGGLHRTQKPVGLLEYFIQTYSHKGDTVLDFTCGSGSTLIACMNTDRKGIGIELNHDFFKVAHNRILAHDELMIEIATTD